MELPAAKGHLLFYFPPVHNQGPAQRAPQNPHLQRATQRVRSHLPRDSRLQLGNVLKWLLGTCGLGGESRVRGISPG